MKQLSICLIAFGFLLFSVHPAFAAESQGFWKVQSIDTMKNSRDAARTDMTQLQINAEVKRIADLGATHVTIDTPYDEDFIPRLKQWVFAARSNNLNVWFRGNFSSWEGWFDRSKNMTRTEHINATKTFILGHADLFSDGDIFTACPECENGSSGDPRTTDLDGFRQFLISEHQVTEQAFAMIGKKVTTNYTSMNGDVARLVMDQTTTEKTGGIVSIDHYVPTPQKLVSDAQSIAKQSGGQIVLGEVGVPIPDIHGNLNEKQQADWMDTLMASLVEHPEVVALNYWVDQGGSTELWNSDGSPRMIAAVIRGYFKPHHISGTVGTSWGVPVAEASVQYLGEAVQTDEKGRFDLPIVPNKPIKLHVSAKDFAPVDLEQQNSQTTSTISIQLVPTSDSFVTEFRIFLEAVKDKIDGLFSRT
jgi:hypothetical protein